MAKSEMVKFEKEMREEDLGAEKISLCRDVIRGVYIGQNIRKEGTLQSDFDNFDIALIKLLVKHKYIERDRFYSHHLYCTTEKGSKIGKIAITNIINNKKEFIENFLAEQPQKVLNFIIREHLLKEGRPPLYIYPVDANDISGFNVKDRLRKNNKIHTEWTSVLSTLKTLGLCIRTHDYVSTDRDHREEKYVISPEILEFLVKHCPKEEVFTPGEYDKMRVYDVLSYFMRSSDYSSGAFKDALRERLIDFELEPEKVNVVIDKMAEVGITSGYRGFQSSEAPFSIKDQYRYEDWLEKNLIVPVVESLLGASGKGGNGSVGDHDGTVEVISNGENESIGVSSHILERGVVTKDQNKTGVKGILVGYECGTGSPVNIKPAHLFISGLTQKAGKTTTLEALVQRSGLKTISFITKPNEACFDTGDYHLPFFQEEAEWLVIEMLFEAQLGEKMKDIRATLIELCKNEKTLKSIKDKIDEAVPDSKGSKRNSLILLQAYFEKLFNSLEGKEYTSTLNLKSGINLMDLKEYNEELQSYIINSVLNEILKNQENTVVIIPEAWKFIPQSKSRACKYSIEQLIRQGAVKNNFVWFDSQDIAGVDKTILKSVSIWMLGLQTEINEVKHTIVQISLPKNQRPTEDQIMTLEVGVFFVCADGFTKKAYVMPKWESEEKAKKTAKAIVQFKKE